MPVEIGWLVEGRVSYFRYMGDIHIDEVMEASQIGLTLIEQTDAALLHTIQDNHAMTSFPKRVAPLVKSVRDSLSHPRMGWMLSVGLENELTRFVATFVSNITRTRHRIVADLPAAKTFLNQIDPALPDLTPFAPPTCENILYRIDKSQETDNP